MIFNCLDKILNLRLNLKDLIFDTDWDIFVTWYCYHLKVVRVNQIKRLKPDVSKSTEYKGKMYL